MNHQSIKPRLTDRDLQTFVSQKYHWKTLPPDKVYAMALELQRLRFIMTELGRTQERINRGMINELEKSD